MNKNNLFSILAVVSRLGKLIGALLSIIGYLGFAGTISGLVSGAAAGAYDSMRSSEASIAVLHQLQLAYDMFGLIRAGVIVLFAFAMADIIFSLAARQGIVASVVDGCSAVASFIISFNFNLPAELAYLDLSSSLDSLSSMSALYSMSSYIFGAAAAVVIIFVIAVVNIRAVLPTDHIEISIPNRRQSAYRPVYNAAYAQQAPNAAYGQNAGYAQQAPNAAYGQNAGYAQQAPNAAYGQNAGYAQQAPNAAYGQNAGYAQQAPNAAYGQNAGYAQQAPNAAYGQNAGYAQQAPNAAYGQNAGYAQQAPNAAYGQNAGYAQQGYPQQVNPQQGGYPQQNVNNQNRM